MRRRRAHRRLDRPPRPLKLSIFRQLWILFVSHANQRNRLSHMAEGSAKHVAVLMGGWSAERDVSLRSGKACADALARLGYRVTPIDVTPDIAVALAAAKPDIALNVLHGRPGEDGTLQGVLEILGIPYSHSGVMASAVAMQKDFAKILFRRSEEHTSE